MGRGCWSRIWFSYDTNNRLEEVEDGYGARVRYGYDCLGNLTWKEEVIEEGVHRRSHYHYNKNGWLIRKEEEIEGNGGVKEAITRYEYDENGNVTAEYTLGGHEIQRRYDGNDRLIEERTLDKQNGIDWRVCYWV